MRDAGSGRHGWALLLGALLVGWLLERTDGFSVPFALLAVASLLALDVIHRVPGQEELEAARV